VFREVRRVLRDDGTAWVNMGDSYCSRPNGSIGKESRLEGEFTSHTEFRRAHALRKQQQPEGLKHKDLIGVPWMLAFTLRADGWYLRQDIIWSKPNPMPESVRDRCTKAHEYVFLLSKSERYYFDQGAIAEQTTAPERDQAEARAARAAEEHKSAPSQQQNGIRSRKNSFARTTKDSAGEHGQKPQFREDREPIAYEGRRNKRSVWTVSTKPYSGAHFAVFPPDLIEPCILAGAPAGGVVLDPFFGSGTTGEVAQRLGRSWIGCELNPAYKPLQDERLRQPGLVLEAA
jgi:DNA modification methylase